jgi:hypothetical protein
MTKTHSNVAIAAAMLLLLMGPVLAYGKAGYEDKAEMLKQAEIIALVDITKVESAKAKGKTWTYSEVASAKAERVLKGKLPNEVKLYGRENFICAQVRYQPGKFLVFLRHDEDMLVGVNWHLGVRPVSGETVEWLSGDDRFATKVESLATVLQEIETVLKQ